MKIVILTLTMIALAIACTSLPVSPKGQAEIVAHEAVTAANLANCRAVGRDAGTYAAYDACTTDAGIK